MKIWLTRILMGLVVVLIVALVGGAIFLLTFDPNAYKSRLEQVVYERYHRTLSIDGDIELSLFPRIGLAVQDVSLSDRDSDDTFASIDSARFAVAIWPLLSNRLVVDHVAVTGFKAWLVRDPEGRFNFRDLVQNRRVPYPRGLPQGADGQLASLAASESASIVSADYRHNASPVSHDPIVLAATDVDRADFQIDIAGLDLKGGELHFLDRKTGALGRIEQVDLTTGRMTFDQAFDVSFKGKLTGNWPETDAQLDGQALVQVDPVERMYSAQRVNLQLNGLLGDLDASSVIVRGNLAYNEYAQMFSASNLDVQVRGETRTQPPITNLEASLIVPQLRIDRSQAELQVTRLALRARGEQPESNFDIAVDAPNLSISPEAAKSEPLVATFRQNERGNDLGISLHMSGLGGDAFDLTLKELKLDSTQKRGDRLVSVQMSSPATWSPFGRQGGLSAMKGDVRIEDTTLPGGTFQFPFIGSLHADLYKDELTSAINAVFGGNKIDFSVAVSQLNDPHVAFDLTADNVDLNTLFPPPKKPAPASEPAASDGAEQTDDKPAEPAPPPAPEAVRQFDWSFLNSAHVQGNIKANALKAGGLALSELEAAITAQDGILHIRDIHADLYGGSIASNVSFSSDHDVTLDLTAVNVDVQPLMQAFAQRRQGLTGRADFEVGLTTQGATTAALIAGLDGSVKGQVRDGAWIGLNLGQTIVEINEVLRNTFSGQVPGIASRFDASRRTEFDTLDIDVALSQGQGAVQELKLLSPLLRVENGQPASVDLVNRQLDLMLLVRGQDGGESKALNFAALEGVSVPIRVSGSFRDPSYQIQWQDIGHRAVKEAIQGGLLDILSQLPAEGGGPFLLPLTKESDTAKRDPLKSIGDALKGLLGQ